jgi:organic hydroperoxide reductase OsmC/OhrA
VIVRRGKRDVSNYFATIRWSRGDAAGAGDQYSRAHSWTFDGGVEVPASSSPHVVPPPLSKADAVDPEEAFVASLSSCHMLWFLDLAHRRGFVVDDYVDAAEGVMAKNAEGKLAMTVVTLRPRIAFSGEKQPTREEVQALHHRAHERCFIASSVKSDVRVEPVFD